MMLLRPLRLGLVLLLLTVSPLLALGADPGATPLPASGPFPNWVPVHQGQFAVTNQSLFLLGGMGWLRSDRTYTNFVLEVEWRALDSGYDSGIFLRAGLDGKPWPTGGWQVNLASAALGGLVKGTRTVVRAENPPAPLNQWVKFRIQVQGKKVSLQVDGEEAWTSEAMDVEAGYLGIQAENKRFEFRNLKIKEL